VEWFRINYMKLMEVCKSVAKQNNVDELLHYCIDQVITNEKFLSIENDAQRYFYFTRIVLNNYNSKTSPYHRTYRNDKVSLIGETDVEDKSEYVDKCDLDWVKIELKEMMKEEWYYARLFELYIEENCNLSKLNKRTTIPLGPLSRDINKVRTQLKNKRKKINGL